MLHKEFFGLIFLGFVFWIIIATSPGQRIENACRPVGWSGNVVTSLSALVLPSQQTTVQNWFDKVEYGCRYTTWRLFYQDAYNQWKASASRNSSVPPAETGSSSSAGQPSRAGDAANPSPVPAPASAPTSSTDDKGGAVSPGAAK